LKHHPGFEKVTVTFWQKLRFEPDFLGVTRHRGMTWNDCPLEVAKWKELILAWLDPTLAQTLPRAFLK